MMMLFSVLLEGSVLFTISFCAVSQHAFQVAAEAALSRSAPPARSTWLCAAGLAALGARLAFGRLRAPGAAARLPRGAGLARTQAQLLGHPGTPPLSLPLRLAQCRPPPNNADTAA